MAPAPYSNGTKRSHFSRNSLWKTPATKRTILVLSRHYKVDPDDVLIILWDYSKKPKFFSYVENERSVIKTKHFLLVHEILSAKLNQEIEVGRTTTTQPKELKLRSFDFSNIGTPLNSTYQVTKNEILRIHEELTEDMSKFEDPISPSGVKDENLLDSALFHSQTAYDGIHKYSTVESSAAALMYAVSNNHAFHNGNKRTALVAMLIYLNKNNISIVCDEDMLFKISLDVADHRITSEEFRYPDAEIYELTKWIRSNSRVITKGERYVTLRKFRQILPRFGAILQENGRVSRTINLPRTSMFGGPKNRILQSKRVIAKMPDGSQVSPVLIRAIRKDLELDHEHGVDSDSFYENTEFTSSEFIIKYSNLLRRLSRV